MPVWEFYPRLSQGEWVNLSSVKVTINNLILPPFSMEVNSQRNNLLPLAQIQVFQSGHYFGRAWSDWEANRKSQIFVPL